MKSKPSAKPAAARVALASTPYWPQSDAEWEALIAAAPQGSAPSIEERAALDDGLFFPAGTTHEQRRAAVAEQKKARTPRSRERGLQKAPTLARIGLRLGQDVAARWRATGPGWQTRMAEWVARGPA